MELVKVIALLMLAQPAVNNGPPAVKQDGPPAVVEEIKIPARKFSTYAEGMAKAIKESKPLVVFVEGAPREVAGVVVASSDVLPGYPSSCIILAMPDGKGWMNDAKVLSPKATNTDILRALGAALARQVSLTADPFSLDNKRQSSSVLPEDQDDNDTGLVSYETPEGVRFYNLSPLYQNMYTMNNGASKFAVPTTIHNEESHPFLVSGGMAGLRGWSSKKGLLLPKDGKIIVWKELTDVRAFSLVPRWRWRFPEGTVAFDILSTDKGVFEVRTQTRGEDGWETKVTFRDEEARPAGYNGLQQSCASCHSHTGEIVGVPGRIYMRERWGSDGRFSFRPYTESGQLDYSWPLDVR